MDVKARAATAGDAGEAHVSGAVLLDQLQLAAKLLDEDTLERALRRMPEAARAELGELLPVSWCSLTTAALFHAAVAAETRQDIAVWHRTIVRAGVERTLTTVWRLFTRLMSVEALVKRAAAIYAKSYDRGAFSARLVQPGFVVATLTEWEDVPAFELDAIVSGFEAVLGMARKTVVSIRYARSAGGATFEVRYEA